MKKLVSKYQTMQMFFKILDISALFLYLFVWFSNRHFNFATNLVKKNLKPWPIDSPPLTSRALAINKAYGDVEQQFLIQRHFGQLLIKVETVGNKLKKRPCNKTGSYPVQFDQTFQCTTFMVFSFKICFRKIVYTWAVEVVKRWSH